MRNLVSTRVKANANYQCRECGSTELIQAHHAVPGDDNTLVPLCAHCHSQKHSMVPKKLFLCKTNQPYWHNKSAASLARQIGVHPRTIIRAAKRLQIGSGHLSHLDQELISTTVSLRRSPRLQALRYMTAPRLRKRLGLSRFQFDLRIERGVLPAPTLTDITGVRYFNDQWLIVARAIIDAMNRKEVNHAD